MARRALAVAVLSALVAPGLAPLAGASTTTVVARYDMESPLYDWTLTGLWTHQPQTHCRQHHSGNAHLAFVNRDRCTYDVLFERTTGEARFPVDLRGQTSAEMRWWHGWQTERQRSGFDVMRVEARVQGGSAWTTLREWKSASSTPQEAWNWHLQTVDLTAFAGSRIDIRFFFDSVDSQNNGFQGWTIDTITVTATHNAPPVVSAGPDLTLRDADGDGGVAVSILGSAADTDGSVVSTEWSEGSTVLATGLGLDTVASVGVHTYTLTARDDEGGVGVDAATVTVLANSPPVVSAGPDKTVSDGDADGDVTAVLVGTASDPDGPVVVEWFHGSTVIATTASFTAELPLGDHVLTLRATDEAGVVRSDDMVLHAIPNRAPVARAGADRTASDADGDGAVSFALDAGTSTDPDGTIVAYAWSVGGEVVGTAAKFTATVPPGTYTYRVEVTDDGGATTADEIRLEARPNLPPVPRLYAWCQLDTCTLSSSGSSDDGSIVSYAWDFGDGTYGEGAWVSHRYAEATTWTACLTLTDNAGATARDCTSATTYRVVLADHFDSGTIFSMGGAWGRSTCKALDGSHSLGFENGCSMSDTGGPVSTASAPVDLSGYSVARLRFDYYARQEPGCIGGPYGDDCEDGYYDLTVRVESSPGTFQDLYRDAGSSSWGFWNTADVSLSAYTGRLVRIYLFGSGNDYTGGSEPSGIYVDAFQVLVTAFLPPVANAGPFVAVGDADGDGTETVRLSGAGSYGRGSPIVSYTWTEGATVLGTGQQLDVPFAVGTHSVRLRVTDARGASADATKTVIVRANSVPHADAGPDRFAADPDGDGFASVVLDGASSYDTDGAIASWRWTEDGADLATVPTFTHAFAVGEHVVRLEVTDGAGAKDMDDVRVTVAPNRPPTANAGADLVVGDAGLDGFEDVRLVGAGSDPDGPLASVVWKEDGAPLATGLDAVVRFATGTHSVTLEVVDQAGVVATDDVLVTVADNQAPVASFEGWCYRTSCTFNASASRDPEGLPLAFAWDLGDGAVSTAPALVHQYADGGPRHVCILVTDAAGISSEACRDFLIVAVLDVEDFDDGVADGWALTGYWHVGNECGYASSQPYYLGFHDVACTYQGLAGGTASFEVDLSDVTAPSLAWRGRWELEAGASSPEFIAVEASADGLAWTPLWKVLASQTPAWTPWQTETVSLAAFAGAIAHVRFVFDGGDALFNSQEGWYVDHVEILTTGPRPAVRPVAAIDVSCVGSACTLDGSASTAGPGGVAAWEWDLGDGSTAMGPVVEHTFATGRSWPVTLTVTDARNATGEASVELAFAPTSAPTSPQVVDRTSTIVVDTTPNALDVRSAWFTADARNLYVGMHVGDLPPEGAPGVAYVVNFVPRWTLADPTWGGTIAPGRTFAALRLIAEGDGDGMDLRLALLEASGASRFVRAFEPLRGAADPSTNIVWWIVPRALIQSPPDGTTLGAVEIYSEASAPRVIDSGVGDYAAGGEVPFPPSQP